MRGPPSVSNVAVALTSIRSAMWPLSASAFEKAIAKQDACAAATSSSGDVLPAEREVRDAQVTSCSSNAPLAGATRPPPWARSPSQTAFAVLSAAILLPPLTPVHQHHRLLEHLGLLRRVGEHRRLLARREAGDEDRLRAAVLPDPRRPVAGAHARLLHAGERSLLREVVHERVVDAGGARLDLAGHPLALVNVAREDARVEAIGRVVGQVDRLILVADLHDG